MAKKKTSPTPSGLGLSRSRSSFTATWKGSYNKVTYFRQGFNTGWWADSGAFGIGTGVTSHSININEANYCPNTGTFLKGIRFAVQGQNKKKKISAWSGWGTMNLYPPMPPTVKFERNSAYSTTFTMDLPQHINDRQYYGTHIQYRTVLRINQNDSSPEDIPENAWGPITRQAIYNGITQQDTTSFTYVANDEDNSSAIKNSDDAVRWLAARAAGPPGYSNWVYSRVAYSEPYPAVIKRAIVKPNDRRGVDCLVEWDYKISVSFPVDTMKVQYSFAAPSGVYIAYALTQDQSIVSGKQYYTLTATYVEYPTTDDIAKYYNKIESKYYSTSDDEIEEGKTYYIADEVLSPETSDIDTYYVNVDGEYVKTTDIEVEDDKTYYTISIVENPVVADIDTYYEATNSYFEKTTDNAIVKNKKYYTVVGATVANPSATDLYRYYDLVETNLVEPLNPNWQDAEIGGDNTIVPSKPAGALEDRTAMIGFSIDNEIPGDQLLYVRVVTTYNSKSTYSGYYMCTDDSGEVSDKETLLTEPSFGDNPSPGSTNHWSLSISNNSEASGVYIAVVFIPPNTEDGTEVISVLKPNQNGEASGSIEIPPQYATTGGWGFGTYAFIGQYSLSARIGGAGTGSSDLGYDLYLVSPIIRSKLVTWGGDIPLPPTDVTANHIGSGNVLVTWNWNWKEADRAEIAWSDYSEALDSNNPPTTYEVPNSKNNRLIVRDLELGKTWYFWVRLIKEENPSVWSNVVFENLSSSPSVPSLSLSKRYINLNEKFTASWTYVSTDGSSQQAAKICLCDVNNGTVTYQDTNLIAEIPNEEVQDKEVQYVILDPKSDKLNWEEGKDYYLAVQVTSDSGMISEKWSDPVQITTIKPITSSLISSSLSPTAADYDSTATYSIGDYTIHRITDPDEPEKERGILYKCINTISTAEEWNEENWMIDENQQYLELSVLPLTANVVGSDNVTGITAIIERSRDYFVDRPDEGTYGGHAGEIAAQINSDGYISINQSDLIGYLDDGAYYYLTIRSTDNYGQSHEVRYEFVVHWTHQALEPVASIELDKEYRASKITIGTPEIPQGDSIEGDSCDIYRKSADGYEILYSGASFNETYVDPYPTLGDHGGYRVVYKTRNGDYIMSDNNFAWIDLDDEEYFLHSKGHLIDFDGDQIELMYNVDIDNSWRKDFTETHYLGGSIQGDWNDGVSKTTSMNVNILMADWESISDMRRLARHKGECHVRTRDGSNFLANVEVSEKLPYAVYTTPDGKDTQLCEYSLSITRLDPIEPDGMTLEEWLNTLPDET